MHWATWLGIVLAVIVLTALVWRRRRPRKFNYITPDKGGPLRRVGDADGGTVLARDDEVIFMPGVTSVEDRDD